MDQFQSQYFYLIKFKFLGFRYHGWQKQPGVKTVQSMIEKTIQFVLGPDANFKTLGASRTDAMVSARDFPMELFLYEELDESFLDEFNKNLPADIHALSIEQVDSKFNVIQDVVSKEYLNIWNCETDELTVLEMDVVEKINKDQEKRKRKKKRKERKNKK